jgi:hypothetical protein
VKPRDRRATATGRWTGAAVGPAAETRTLRREEWWKRRPTTRRVFTSPRRFRSADWSSAGLRTCGRAAVGRWTYWSSLPSSREPVRNDDGRSRLPLRGSPGFTPGSLLTPSRARAGYRRSDGNDNDRVGGCQGIPVSGCGLLSASWIAPLDLVRAMMGYAEAGPEESRKEGCEAP